MTVEIETSIWQHISDLRNTFFKVLMYICVGFVLTLFFYKPLISFLITPFSQDIENVGLTPTPLKKERLINYGQQETVFHLPADVLVLTFQSPGVLKTAERTYLIPSKGFVEFEQPVSTTQLIITSPTEGMLTTFKVCFWVALLGSSPCWLFSIVRFVTPGLRPYELRLLLPFLLFSGCMISVGFLFAYYITIPLGNRYLMFFNAGLGLNLWSLSNYLDYTLFLLFANGLAFELAVVGFFLVHLGVLKADQMKSKRRHFILLSFIIGAILTPPDILSQVMLALPLIVLYELMILYAVHLRNIFSTKIPA